MFSRFSVLAARPRHTLGALAVVLAAVGVAVGSGANFTAQVASATNTFSSGTLSIGGNGGTAVFNVSNLKPGDVKTGFADIQNTGSVSGTFSLGASNLVDPDGLLDQLDLDVVDCGTPSGPVPLCTGNSPVANGKVSGLTFGNSLGVWAPGETHRYKFTVTFPDQGPAIDNTFQGKSGSIKFVWNAAS